MNKESKKKKWRSDIGLQQKRNDQRDMKHEKKLLVEECDLRNLLENILSS